MATVRPCFELYIVDNGFVVHHKLPNIESGNYEIASTNVYETARDAVEDLWRFIRPYANMPAYEGALPAELE